MITIQLTNPSINEYIQSMGKEKVKEMFLTYLEIKAKFHNSSQKEENSEPLYKQFGISEELHNKLLALKPKKESKAKEINSMIDEISSRFGDEYANKSIEDIRDEYFASKGY